MKSAELIELISQREVLNKRITTLFNKNKNNYLPIKIKGSSDTVRENSSKRKTRETKLMHYLNSKGFGITQSSSLVAKFSNKSPISITRGTIHPTKTAGKNNIDIDPKILDLDRIWIDNYIKLFSIKINPNDL